MRIWYQWTFEIEGSILYHWKVLEKCYSTMIFSKTITKTIPSKNPENPRNNPQNWYVKEKNFNKYDILYIVETVLKRSIQWWFFRDRWLKLIPCKNHWNLVCQWKILNKSGVLYNLEKVNKCRIRRWYFRRRPWKIFLSHLFCSILRQHMTKIIRRLLF